MAYLPKEYTVWMSTKTRLKPNHMERIVFHLKTAPKDEWLCGFYNEDENKVEIHHNPKVYETFPWDGISHWLRIPQL